MRIAGYAAVFDRVDSGGDVIRKGAFSASLARGQPIPLLWQHKAGAVIGKVEMVEEDTRGLRVIAELGGDADSARAAGLLASGALDGLSFGYRVGQAASANWVRELRELELVEVSLVTSPMQKLARVHAVEN